VAAPSHLIDLKHLHDLAGGITETPGGGIMLGALTPLAAIEQHPLVRERFPVLAEAAASAATLQLRNMATLGGNLLQRPRCWYFRSPLFHCWLKGGDECHAREGENQQHALVLESPCVAVHPSDPANALLALDARVRIAGRGDERTVGLGDFFCLPGDDHRRETVLRDNELLLSVEIPPPSQGTRCVYLKAMNRKVWSFALVAVAAVVHMESGRIAGSRLVLGGVAPIPWRAEAAERVLEGATPEESAFERAANAALEQARPLAYNGYKLALARGLIRQALRRATS
jgi:xanthine dehydrogenase YagS FAD-binding subunit